VPPNLKKIGRHRKSQTNLTFLKNFYFPSV
jgi:hypothetical protein